MQNILHIDQIITKSGTRVHKWYLRPGATRGFEGLQHRRPLPIKSGKHDYIKPEFETNIGKV